MKFIYQIIAVLLLITCAACSRDESINHSESPAPKTTTDVINAETISINNAKKTLEDSKLVDKTFQNSAAEQRETIEKTQQ